MRFDVHASYWARRHTQVQLRAAQRDIDAATGRRTTEFFLSTERPETSTLSRAGQHDSARHGSPRRRVPPSSPEVVSQGPAAKTEAAHPPGAPPFLLPRALPASCPLPIADNPVDETHSPPRPRGAGPRLPRLRPVRRQRAAGRQRVLRRLGRASPSTTPASAACRRRRCSASRWTRRPTKSSAPRSTPQIQAPIADWIRKNSAQDRILYIVLTKGIPLRVKGTSGRDGTMASVDSELTLLYRRLTGAEPPLAGPLANPYFLGDAADRAGEAVQPPGLRHLPRHAPRRLHRGRCAEADRPGRGAVARRAGSCWTRRAALDRGRRRHLAARPPPTGWPPTASATASSSRRPARC